jgi:hypothetical protein
LPWVFRAIRLDPLPQERWCLSLVNFAKPNAPVKVLQMGVRYCETLSALQNQPNFLKYSRADSLPLERGLNAHPAQHLNTVLVCDPHRANKVIPA